MTLQDPKAGFGQGLRNALIYGWDYVTGNAHWRQVRVDTDGRIEIVPIGGGLANGIVQIDQTTPNANDVVLKASSAIIGSVRVPYVSQALHPFAKGLLTADGQQYSALLTTSTDAYEVVESVTVVCPTGMTLAELGFGLTMAIQSSGAGESVLYKWQGSDDGIAWVDLNTEITRAASAAALLDVSVSGWWLPVANFLGSGATFQLRAVIKSGGAGGETAKGKTKSSSWVLPVWRY